MYFLDMSLVCPFVSEIYIKLLIATTHISSCFTYLRSKNSLKVNVFSPSSSPTDRSVMFALVGDTVVLPCGIPSVKSCMSINWNMAGAFGSVTEVVKAGEVTAANERRLLLLKDCSLQITHLVNDDARVYTCGSGSLHSNVTLQLLQRKSTDIKTSLKNH